MDGRFVPNITIGPPVVSALRRATKLHLDVHLMIVEPEKYVEAFAEAGADTILVHVEACTHLHRTLQSIRKLGKRAGVVLNPATHESSLAYVLDVLDQVLVMSVNPGFGGQSFIPEVLPKVRAIRSMIGDAERRHRDRRGDGAGDDRARGGGGDADLRRGERDLHGRRLREDHRCAPRGGRARDEGMRARAIVLAGAVACASGGAPEVAPSVSPRIAAAQRPTPSARDPRVARALEEMSHVRELSVLREVGSAIVPRAELIRALEAHVARDVPRAEIEDETAFLRLLGVLGLDDDYERAVFAAVRRVAGGVYLPERAGILLPDDLPAREMGTSLAHEAVHALQDQHFGLEAFERYVPGASDAMLARSCLAEGDATSATEEDPADVDGTYVERELAAPYVAGTAFVRALRERGGWAEVDRAWTRGALTTEQVLHPEKWASGEGAIEIAAPTFAALGDGYVRGATDTHGELGVRLVLESAMPHARAVEAASGWGGDRSVLARRGSSAALAWRIRWDDDASAERGFHAISAAFARGRACSDERAVPTGVTRKGRDALVLVGPPGSSCALLAAWSKEVL